MQDLFAEQLKALRAASLDSHLREISSSQGPEIEIDGRRFVNVSSNNYLGLANDSRLRKAAIAAINEFGLGAGASRLISGTQSPHVRLERALAKWKGTEAALCFSSGYATALGAIPALVTKDDVILLDKLCHASLIAGAKLSGAIPRVFPHNNVRKLESLLEWARREHPGKRVLIVTESVFSMDGDRAPLRELVELKKRFAALLMLDEAHAVGVIGANGRGLAAEENVSDDVDVKMGTLSKALGASGGYICGSRDLIEWLLNRTRSFVYSIAPPPAVAAAALAAVNFLSSSEGEKRRLLLWGKIYLIRKFLLALSGKRSTLKSQLKLRQRDFPLDRGTRTSGAQSRVCAAKRRIHRSSDSLSHRGQRRRAVAHYRDGIAPGRSDPFALRSDQTKQRSRVIL